MAEAMTTQESLWRLETQRLNDARRQLLAALSYHESLCGDEMCRFKANVLAWLAHSLGATNDDLKAFPKLLVEYDLHCERNGGCEGHRQREASGS